MRHVPRRYEHLAEVSLDQVHADEVQRFLTAVPASELCLTDFTLFSIGIRLLKHHRSQQFNDFVADVIAAGQSRVVEINPRDLVQVSAAAQVHGLDFDDAYQYAVAKAHNLTIVSFDAHFDRTPRGRKTPGQVLAEIHASP